MLFPNPAGEEVFILMKKWQGKSARLTLFNQLGIQVLEKNVDKVLGETERLDLSEILNGQYFLKLETPDERAVFGKLVVARLY